MFFSLIYCAVGMRETECSFDFFSFAFLSDQLSTYYRCLRRSIKWYKKVAFELVFGTAVVNSYLIYKENYIPQATRPFCSFAKVLCDLYSLVCHSRNWNLVPDNDQQVVWSANSLITSSKKRKDLIAMSKDAVPAATRKSDNNNQEKQVMRQQRQ